MRRKELIDEGATAQEIQSIIQREFNIFLRLKDIQAKINTGNSRSSDSKNVSLAESNSTTLEKIKEFLPSSGMKSREISVELRKRFNVNLPKRDVFRLLYPNDEFCYSPITFKWTKQTKNNKKEPQLDDLIPRFAEFISELKSQAENSIIQSKSGFPLLDNAMMHAVRDNIISENELRFLKNLASRVGYNGNLEELIQRNLHAQNPYLDSLIHGAFHDGIIEDYEIHTIAEQGESIGFDEMWLTQRFWSIALTDYFSDLIKISSFDRFLKFTLIRKCRGQNITPIKELTTAVRLRTESSFTADIDSLSRSTQLQIGSDLNGAESELLAHDSSELIFTSQPLASISEDNNTDEDNLSIEKMIKIMHEEKDKLGDPIANLLVENILFQIDIES